MNVIVRCDIVDEVFAAVRNKTAVKLNTVRVLWRHVVWRHPALDVTIQIILKIILFQPLCLEIKLLYLSKSRG